ncbi:DNA-binding transcriptional LysR family regulator [Duganella sp. 1224]|uniref:LysR family transcriptional regulator n=1 Tax=Duganella sp. 1224 TaxID=2587052 RepID=UPI0015C7A7E3|nr:LysR family transcriptional regulator [Duganella sp. 1224]NYE62084.1 DNA-binding transcriptional LysR family regulator [Duganella sp. 1224]
MNKLLWMHCLVRAIETGSFSAVARELGIGQPNVSRHIASLEQTLGTRLLNRSTRQLVPTPDGQRYYALAKQALDVIQQAESEARGQHNPHGLLRVACPSALATEKLVDALPEFLTRYPDVEVELKMGDGYVDLIAEGVDLAIRGGVLKDSALRARRVGTSERICVASRAYLDKHGTPQRVEDLLHHECLIYTLLAGDVRGWPLDNGEVQVSGRLRLNSLEAIRRAALAGLGIAYLPAWMVAQHLRSGELAAVLGASTTRMSPLNAVYSADRLLPQRATVFIDFIAALLARTPGLDGRSLLRSPDS